MKQQTLAGFETYGKTTRRAQFLAQMDEVLPWSTLCSLIEPVYRMAAAARVAGRRCRWSGCCASISCSCGSTCLTPAVKEALYDSAAMRSFVGIDLGREAAPDETTVCKFRHLLEKHKRGEALCKAVNRHLHKQGIKVSMGTILDAMIINAASSTKIQTGERDPEIHQTAKGKQRFFGMKADIGVELLLIMQSMRKLIGATGSTTSKTHPPEASFLDKNS